MSPSNKPIFVATHPRACSTAFERVFMTRRDILTTVHEPLGDAFYYGPERLSDRYEHDEKAREESGFGQSTFKTIFDRIDSEGSEGKRIFIKDIAHYIFPPDAKPASIAPSLLQPKKGVGTAEDIDGVNGVDGSSIATSAPANPNATSIAKQTGKTVPPYPYATVIEPRNPTVVPEALLKQFHFTFLIRHPRRSIPSYYRCTVPPLDEITGFYNFMPSEAGYDELRRLFDYLRTTGQIGPKIAGQSNANSDSVAESTSKSEVEICVVDADDLLDNPAGIIEAYCKSVGIKYDPGMLKWDSDDDQKAAKEAFEKWKGFHEDALDSKELKPRLHKKKVQSNKDEDAEWAEKFGPEGAKIIRQTVDANVADYEYLKQFAIKAA
ncbi:hypothetical protein L228DRAFT_237054 [Xylona heveae TC161]|uniref:P-loop containing nucleoside triphosphate hydrolase protein n=1 Tax=Xylona heveae (strain CBS 132557 / TC161) TaxID=1328760 RepID=A0A165HY66_XYLHT|nr:hypothetical protein L228DRAFT_237054 [Xylona heveae TC161]KZF24091.1 hypothetical protein L228DRAFT_237054 [Xylona heveae TC161]